MTRHPPTVGSCSLHRGRSDSRVRSDALPLEMLRFDQLQGGIVGETCGMQALQQSKPSSLCVLPIQLQQASECQWPEHAKAQPE